MPSDFMRGFVFGNERRSRESEEKYVEYARTAEKNICEYGCCEGDGVALEREPARYSDWKDR